MKTITLVVYNRPEYTGETIASLRANRLAGYRLYIAAEPGCGAVLEICRSVDFMPMELIVNPVKLGIHWNNKNIYERVFRLGSEFNVAIEDDTPLAPDALDLANWFFALPQRDEYLLCNLFSGSRDRTLPLEVAESDAMCPWAYCFTRTSYEAQIAPGWMCDERGWDWAICAIMRKKRLKSLAPVLSRSRNIGRLQGTFCTPQYHDECFGGHVASDGNYGVDFKLVRSGQSNSPVPVG